MKTYSIICKAEAHGRQFWTVEALNEADARRMHAQGESSFESEELEVTQSEVETIEEIKPLE